MNDQTRYPKVSVIMPTFNRAVYIRESVESVLKQSYGNWELIIVDDGSEDDTEAVIAGITDSRIQFYKAGKIGLGIKLKNIGIARSTGELIAFLDSDDLWAADKLEKQVAVLQDHPDAGFSITGGYNFIKRGEPVEYFYKQREGARYGNIFLSFFQSEASALPQTLLMKRECLPVIEEYTRSNPFSDVEFLLGLALNYKAVILYEPLLYRRLHPDSFSTRNWEKGYEEGIEVIRRYRADQKLPATIARGSLFRLYINYGEDYRTHGQRVKAIRCFFNAWGNRPFSIVPLKKMIKTLLGSGSK